MKLIGIISRQKEVNEVSTTFDPPPGVGIQHFMKEHRLSVLGVSTLLAEFQVHDHDIRSWVDGPGQKSAAAALCFYALTQVPEDRIAQVVADEAAKQKRAKATAHAQPDLKKAAKRQRKPNRA
jgi:hypothetical protein